jgi:hypothetical protein
VESCAPDDVGDVQRPAIFEQRSAIARADDARNAPNTTALRSERLTRISGPPPDRMAGRTLRPSGVLIVSR